MYLYLDIETIPLGEPDPTQVRVPANYKDPEKIYAYQAENAERIWREGSLDPMRGRVCAVAMAVDDAPVEATVFAEERDALSWISDFCLCDAGGGYGDVLITYNGNRFDRPFLAKRAAAHGLHALARHARPRTPYAPGDLMLTWLMGSREYSGQSLSAVARFFGIERPKTIDGGEILDAWQEGRWGDIVEHVADDVETLRAVHDRMLACGWGE